MLGKGIVLSDVDSGDLQAKSCECVANLGKFSIFKNAEGGAARSHSPFSIREALSASAWSDDRLRLLIRGHEAPRETFVDVDAVAERADVEAGSREGIGDD
jgi:hypothetical protein